MNILVLSLCILSVLQNKLVIGQGEPCYTPSNQLGTCVLLPECPYLIQIYGYNPRSSQVINYLIGSQRQCGNRSVGRNPIVCCNEPAVSFTESPPTTAPPPPAPVTQAPQDDSVRNGSPCYDPSLKEGICRDIYQCPSILSEFQSRPNDQEYVDYLQNSNAICNNIKPYVCCPNDGNSGLPVTREPIHETSENPVTSSPLSDNRLPTINEGCGFSNVTHTRIVGGVPAKLGAFPWMALVGYTNNLDELSFKCGGSLITRKHVLTAAHCLKSTLTNVRLGEHDLSSDLETNSIDVPIVKVARYPDYDPKDGHNDLAILYMQHPVEITDLIRPICIPFQEPIRSRDFEGYQPFVAGWGRTLEGGSSASVLQELQIPVLSNESCKTRYKDVGKLVSEKQFDHAVLCAGVLSGGKDSCQGDSGGPLMQPQNSNGKFYYYQIGIVSYGIGCARANIPGVYTRVQTFVDWIQNKVAE